MCIDDEWLIRNATSSLGKLLFKNGYLNTNTGIFHKEFDSDIVFMEQLPFKYKVLNDEEIEYMMDVKQRFFDIALGIEIGNYFLLQLSRGLAGDLICMKKIMFKGLGPSNSGKSTLVEACQLSLVDYVGTFNAETLAFRDIKR